MSYKFSRRDFLKYSALTAVAVAGAGLLSACEIQDPNNPVYDIGKGITLGNTSAQLTLFNENVVDGTFKIFIRNGGDGVLTVNPTNFMVTVTKTTADGKDVLHYNNTWDTGTNALTIRTEDNSSDQYVSVLNPKDSITLTVKAGNFSLPTDPGCSYTVLFKYFPETYQNSLSIGWKTTGTVEGSAPSEGGDSGSTDGDNTEGKD